MSFTTRSRPMNTITRRTLTLGLSASAAIAAVPASGIAKPQGPRAVLPSVAHRKIGNVQVTALSDGFIDAPFGMFVGAPVSDIETALTARFTKHGKGTFRLGFT